MGDLPKPDEHADDYGYDLAHDASQIPEQREVDDRPGSEYVATETGDTDRDYSYDLAHETPPLHRD